MTEFATCLRLLRQLGGTWTANYFLKLSGQKVLGTLPGLYRLQELVKRIRGRWRDTSTVQFASERIEGTIERFNRCGVRPPRVVVEQGTGWHGLDLVLFFLAGADEIVTYDVRPWLREELFRNCLDQAPAFGQAIAAWNGVNPAVVEERVHAIERARGLDMGSLFRELGITYRVRRSMKRPELASGSVDLFYTYSVLQRLSMADLLVLVDEGGRILQQNGQHYHQVDCKDFHSITDAQVPELLYLAYPEGLWRALTNKYLNYQNRLRRRHFVDILESAGFTTRVPWSVVDEDNVRFVETYLKNLSISTELEASEIAVTQFEMVGERLAVGHEL